MLLVPGRVVEFCIPSWDSLWLVLGGGSTLFRLEKYRGTGALSGCPSSTTQGDLKTQKCTDAHHHLHHHSVVFRPGSNLEFLQW